MNVLQLQVSMGVAKMGDSLSDRSPFTVVWDISAPWSVREKICLSFYSQNHTRLVQELLLYRHMDLKARKDNCELPF